MELTKTNMLKQEYENIAKRYAEKFAEITDKQGEWSSDFSIWFTEYEAYSIEEVRYIVDNFTDKEETWEKVREELSEWVDYLCDCNEFSIQYINLPSWFAGAPRMSKKTREKLHKQKAALMSLIDEQQKEFGKIKNEGIPQHHKKPF